ncbi:MULTISPECIES: PAS domain-containing protein [Loigolactobacillus]|uniref:PAS domain-containing protein n=2 Tax=Loigolactobacillus TaxID=2767889 RepID=A0ABW1RGR3_9LACO|nr:MULTISPECIES: PAS domain-containing protein [Loigolactobacillus]MDA5388755.1 PAS domain-containing protein [Loigolactobacillus backii]MDA5391247.1 PAS domain-containing protein [Loigolactobacillus backii]
MNDQQIKVNLTTGTLKLEQLNAIFKTIPQEFDFIDENDIVRWYSNNTNRLFARDTSKLNQHVLDVHPAHSAGRVKKVLAEMHNGERDSIQMTVPAKGKQIHIAFYALHNDSGDYIGCIEVTEDISEFTKSGKIGNLVKLLRNK